MVEDAVAVCVAKVVIFEHPAQGDGWGRFQSGDLSRPELEARRATQSSPILREASSGKAVWRSSGVGVRKKPVVKAILDDVCSQGTALEPSVDRFVREVALGIPYDLVGIDMPLEECLD